MAKYELTFTVQPMDFGAPLGMRDTPSVESGHLGSGSTQTVTPSGTFNLAEYARISGIPEGEFSAESIERVRQACATRTGQAVVNVNHRPLS